MWIIGIAFALYFAAPWIEVLIAPPAG